MREQQRDASSPRAWQPAKRSDKPWSEWTYYDWNERLLSYCFSIDETGQTGPVTRLAATPDELLLVVDDPDADSRDIAEWFVGVIKQRIPTGTTFCGFCLDFSRGAEDASTHWHVESNRSPHFFAMLWFTCLVAYGYPDPTEGFHNRLTYDIFGKHDQLSRLPELWTTFRDWTVYHSQTGAPLRELVLPPEDSFRTVIGYSYFLTFPHQQDRIVLGEVLMEAGLSDMEPPVRLVLDALEQNRKRFSKFFASDLNKLTENYLVKGRDPCTSAFWRAVLHEAREPSTRLQSATSSPGVITLFAHWDDEELLHPYWACSEDWELPKGFSAERLDFEAGTVTLVVTGPRLDESPFDLLTQAPNLTNPHVVRAVENGVLPLTPIASDEFRLAMPGEVTGCSLALVKTDLTEQFLQLFGGVVAQSALFGWDEVSRCKIREVDALPDQLAQATILLPTTESYRPHFVGGLRTSTSSFYGVKSYLPLVRAPLATTVTLVDGDSVIPLVRTASAQDDDWKIPESVLVDQLSSLTIEASWNVQIQGYEVTRRGICRAHLVPWTFSIDFKGVPAGHYWLETCKRQLAPLSPDSDHVPIGLPLTQPDNMADLLRYDVTARWLGCGIGEMSLDPESGFPWLAVGPKNRPEFVVYEGSNTAASSPNRTVSPEKSDRRHWKRAFNEAKVGVYVKVDGNYLDRTQSGALETAYAEYRSVARRRDFEASGECAPTRLESHLALSKWGRPQPGPLAMQFAEALAVLGSSRSGIPLREIHDHFGKITGTASDHAFRQQVIRAWTELGSIDVLPRQDGRRSVVVPRKPQLLAYRRGPALTGVVMGLLPSTVVAEIERLAQTHSLGLSWVNPSNPFQPRVPRVYGVSTEQLDNFSAALGFENAEYLDWPDLQTIPVSLTITDTLRQDQPPDMYTVRSTWCWKDMSFRREPEDAGEVVLQRRHHGSRAPIFVVLENGRPVAWSYSRTWSLLEVAERSNRPSFEITDTGILRTTGRSPLHLPLPLARLCTLVGIGLPGPVCDDVPRLGRKLTYAYPFGHKLKGIAESVVPESWLVR